MKSIFEFYPTTEPSLEDATRYIQALFFIAGLDGVHSVEESLIKQLVETKGWPLEAYNAAKRSPITDIESLGLPNQVKIVFAPYLIRDLFALAYAHDSLSLQEQSEIRTIAENLGVDHSRVVAIQDAVRSQLSALQKWGAALNS